MAKPDFQLKWGVNRSGGIPTTDPADYQLGWQYRSGLPPLTGNFDYYQNLADERLLYLNAQGIAEWDALTAYDTDAYVKGSDGEIYRATAPTTGNDPTAGAPWTSAQGADFLNTARQNVVSAATTILPTDTAHLNITGTATIGSFTVPADRCYFVRFDAACTLVNSANLVTQRGVDIQCAAGDTCWLRALSDNVVEVGGFTEAQGAYEVISGSNSDGYYRIHPDGYKEMWITTPVSIPATQQGSFQFPTPFTSTPFVVSSKIGSSDRSTDVQVLSITTTNVIITNSESGQAQSVLWSANGY